MPKNAKATTRVFRPIGCLDLCRDIDDYVAIQIIIQHVQKFNWSRFSWRLSAKKCEANLSWKLTMGCCHLKMGWESKLEWCLVLYLPLGEQRCHVETRIIDPVSKKFSFFASFNEKENLWSTCNVSTTTKKILNRKKNLINNQPKLYLLNWFVKHREFRNEHFLKETKKKKLEKRVGYASLSFSNESRQRFSQQASFFFGFFFWHSSHVAYSYTLYREIDPPTLLSSLVSVPTILPHDINLKTVRLSTTYARSSDLKVSKADANQLCRSVFCFSPCRIIQ